MVRSYVGDSAVTDFSRRPSIYKSLNDFSSDKYIYLFMIYSIKQAYLIEISTQRLSLIHCTIHQNKNTYLDIVKQVQKLLFVMQHQQFISHHYALRSAVSNSVIINIF